eukprot:gene10919-12587_t
MREVLRKLPVAKMEEALTTLTYIYKKEAGERMIVERRPQKLNQIVTKANEQIEADATSGFIRAMHLCRKRMKELSIKQGQYDGQAGSICPMTRLMAKAGAANLRNPAPVAPRVAVHSAHLPGVHAMRHLRRRRSRHVPQPPFEDTKPQLELLKSS